ncbi:MAG TPA: YdeI/OmpD-associated family protein [Planctomycetota bacterium]|nr:YdeI/OmpD-associated family protein [Planctomycetota bacterium]
MSQASTVKPSPKVDAFIRKNKRWQAELQKLRTILLDSPLTEEIKWRTPCYTFQGKNVVILGAFKESCVISFLKGALLKDPHGILVKAGENTQSARVIRFTNVQQIAAIEPVLKAYILEAIEAEKAGLKVAFKKPAEFAIPEEFQKKLKESPEVKTAFAALTPGRQRAYLMHFSAAKQSQTREARIKKCIPKILKGKGLDDEYRAKRG